MRPAIHYLVEALFYREKIGNKLEFFQNGGDLSQAITHFHKEFRENTPILAREQALSYFDSIVDVLYDGLGKSFTTDAQARIDLQYYLDSGNAFEFMSNNPALKITVSDDLFNGINIYLVIDKPLQEGEEKRNQRILLHGIRYSCSPQEEKEEILASLDGLIKECFYYEENGYAFQNQYTFLNLDRIGGSVENILKTNYDWDEFMEKYKGEELM